MALFGAGLFGSGLFSSLLFGGSGASAAEPEFMSVTQFLDELYNDELSDMFIANQNDREDSRDKILPLINTGLRMAYAKYKIKWDSTMLDVLEDTHVYVLPETDILSITDIVNEHGRELTTEEVKVLGKTLTFPCPKTVTLEVIYKVRPTRMIGTQNDNSTFIELPDLLVEWLRSFVAARIYGAQKDENAIAKGKLLEAQAESYEELYIATNTTNEFSSGNNCRLDLRGFQ